LHPPGRLAKRLNDGFESASLQADAVPFSRYKPVEADLKMTRCLPIGGSRKSPQSDQCIVLHVEKVSFKRLIQDPAPNEFSRYPFHLLKK